MFDFGGITHILPNSNGTFSLVGSVPLAMMNKRTPTISDIMGGRVADDGYAYVGRVYASLEDVKIAAAVCGAKLCAIPTCACRKTF